MQIFKNDAVKLLTAVTGLDAEIIAQDLETPPDPELGDLAFPCFKLAKTFRKAPAAIAGDLADKLEAGDYFSKIVATGPYINFYFNPETLAREVIGVVQSQGKDYGKREANGQTVVIDFSAPNIAKPFGIGHLRSTMIGNSIYKIYAALGYKVIGINHLGDWGTQFGKLMTAYTKWGDESRLEQDPIKYLYELYVKFHQEAERDPTLEDEGRHWFKRLEDGDEIAQNLWRKFRDLSLEEFKRIYSILGVEFDSYQGESDYNDMLDSTVEEIKATGITEISDGALIVDLEEEGMPPCLLRKTDGATLYATRDLCAAIYRQKHYNFDKLLYVVGSDQSLHFQQFFTVLKKMGHQWAEGCEHVPFGLIRFKEGKMSTRKGTLIYLEEVLERAVELAREIIAQKNPTLPNKDEVANQVGIGAVIFGDLSNDRIKNIEFDWDKVLDFTGETAPYIQYTHARICSILRKTGYSGKFNPGLLKEKEEQHVLTALARYPEVIARAAENNKPSIVARYLIDVAKELNRFYHNCPVLKAEEEVRDARLALIDSVRQVLANGLELLGIQAPQEM